MITGTIRIRAWSLVNLFAFATVGMAQTPSCAPYPGCLYTPLTTYAVTLTTTMVAYIDVAGLERRVPVSIRRPVGKPGPIPVVVWVHGGGEGLTNPLTTMNEWSTVTAQAGYLSITGAHSLRDTSERQRLCAAVGVPTAECPHWQPLHWDRPKDVSAILDELARMNAAGPLRGQIDLSRIVVGGHSAGSAATMSLAGARRILFPGATPLALTDPRPISFVGLSPQGPGRLGFFDTDFRRTEVSWDGVSRPMLTATGDGDARCDGGARDGCEDTSSLRRITFDRMHGPDKYMMYIKDARSFHNLFALKTGECADKNVPVGSCNAFASWLRASVLAFLDFHVEGRFGAGEWLRHPFLKTASAGVTELETK